MARFYNFASADVYDLDLFCVYRFLQNKKRDAPWHASTIFNYQNYYLLTLNLIISSCFAAGMGMY